MAFRSIWNRICQFGCSCPACNTKPTAQQYGRNIWGHFRRPPTTSTVLYTTIFGYATTIDGQIKRQRRDDWEELLAEKRKEVEEAERTLAETAKRILEARYGAANADVQLEWDKAHSELLAMEQEGPITRTQRKVKAQLCTVMDGTHEMRPTGSWSLDPPGREMTWLEAVQQTIELDKDRHIPRRSATQRLVELARSGSLEPRVTDRAEGNDEQTLQMLNHLIDYPPGKTKQPPKIPQSSTLRPHSLSPQSPFADRRIVRANINQAWSAKKTYTMEICMARLVLDLCVEAGLMNQDVMPIVDWPTNLQAYASLSKPGAEVLAKQLEHELFAIRYMTELDTCCRSPILRQKFGLLIPDFTCDFSTGSQMLEEELSQICGQKTTLDRSDITDICSSILVSTGRPSTHIVNILLLAFTRANRPELFRPLVSLITDSHIRPNEITSATLLRFYRQQNDHSRFRQQLTKFMGHPSFMLAKPWDKTFVKMASSQGRCFVANRKLVQAIYPSPITYIEIIDGLLHFTGLIPTVEYIKDFESRGWGFDFTCIYTLLFKSAIENFKPLVDFFSSKAIELYNDGYQIPPTLFALMVAVQTLERDTDQLDRLIGLFRKIYPTSKFEHSILSLVQERAQLIKHFRQKKTDRDQADGQYDADMYPIVDRAAYGVVDPSRSIMSKSARHMFPSLDLLASMLSTNSTRITHEPAS